MLTETSLRTGCLDAFTPISTRSDIEAAKLFQRLLLLVYAYGTNTGIRTVAAGDDGHTEDELRYIRRRYVTVKSGELSSNRREEQEISMICLQILQSALGYINTLMIQDTLAESAAWT